MIIVNFGRKRRDTKRSPDGRNLKGGRGRRFGVTSDRVHVRLRKSDQKYDLYFNEDRNPADGSVTIHTSMDTQNSYTNYAKTTDRTALSHYLCAVYQTVGRAWLKVRRAHGVSVCCVTCTNRSVCIVCEHNKLVRRTVARLMRNRRCLKAADCPRRSGENFKPVVRPSKNCSNSSQQQRRAYVKDDDDDCCRRRALSHGSARLAHIRVPDLKP